MATTVVSRVKKEVLILDAFHITDNTTVIKVKAKDVFAKKEFEARIKKSFLKGAFGKAFKGSHDEGTTIIVELVKTKNGSTQVWMNPTKADSFIKQESKFDFESIV